MWNFCLSKLIQYRAFASSYKACSAVQCTHIHLYTHPNLTNIHTHHCYALRNLFQLSQDNSGQQQILTDTKWHQQTSPDTEKYCLKMCGHSCWHQMAFDGVWWCLIVTHVVWRCGEGVWGVSQTLSQRVSECCLRVCARFQCIWGCLWVFKPCVVKQML